MKYIPTFPGTLNGYRPPGWCPLEDVIERVIEERFNVVVKTYISRRILHSSSRVGKPQQEVSKL
jgi:hypothetical protein